MMQFLPRGTGRILHTGSIAIALSMALAGSASAAALKGYNVDIKQSSVSGISSGGYMAVQMGVAFSATFKGVGVFAGGPYHCAGSTGQTTEATTTCMNASPNAPNVSSFISTTDSRASSGAIDPTSNMANQKFWLFSGTNDTTVKPAVMNALQTYYQHYTSSGNIYYKNNLHAAHAHITDNYGNGCTTSTTPYINNCSYDGPGQLLQWIYGTLNPRNTGTLSGQLLQFDQTEFVGSGKGVDTTGWVYVPASCASGQPCKIHLALHGCLQNQTQIQDKYYTHAGYNEWADTNNIIVLYPQTSKGSWSGPANPNGCWDWWGYNDPSTYDTKTGVQTAAIKKMMDRIASGYTGGSTTTTTRATTTTTAGGTSTTSTATTTTTTAGTCFKSSNYAHVTAGRAMQNLGTVYAKGSNQNMGLYNTYTTTKLRQTGASYYVIDSSCP